MSQENPSSLRFSLEESLWFRKGQEVSELVSISLDPDITIQENDQNVTIHGSLELTGEYKSFEDSNESGEDNNTAAKFVQSVEERDEGICYFSHRFPVDITIPNNRIQSIYEIDVMVDSFDYLFPERSCLKLSAELTISGLYGGQQNELQEEEQQYEMVYRTEEEPIDENYYLESFSEQSEAENSQLFEVEARKQQEESNVEAIHYPNFSYEASNEEFYQEGTIQQVERNIEESPVEVIPEKVLVHGEKADHYSGSEESSSSDSSEESPEKKNVVKKIKEKLIKKKSMSLTEFLARKQEGGEEQAKLKVCIVQKGDTLDKLAERYDITLPNLLHVNHLEGNQDVQEGQVLYIPNAMAKK